MLNRNKSPKGFTLVEVIVVAVIVAILAAIGVPILSGFIADAQQNSVTLLAETAAAAASAHFKRTKTDPDLADLDLHFDATKYDVAINASKDKVVVKLEGKEAGKDMEKQVPYK